LNRIAKEVGSRAKAFKLVKRDKKLVRFYLPLEPVEDVTEALGEDEGQDVVLELWRVLGSANGARGIPYPGFERFVVAILQLGFLAGIIVGYAGLGGILAKSRRGSR